MTHDGHIYNDDERSQIAGSDTIIYDGYNLNKDILSKYDKTFTLQPQTLVKDVYKRQWKNLPEKIIPLLSLNKMD